MLRVHPEVGGERLDRCRRLGQFAGTFDRAPLVSARAGFAAGRVTAPPCPGRMPKARKMSLAALTSGRVLGSDGDLAVVSPEDRRML